MKARLRITALLAVLVLALVLVPAVAMAAPAISQGVQGTVYDNETGVAIPFAHVVVWVDGMLVFDGLTEYDGTYAVETDASDNVDLEAYAHSRYSDSIDDLSVGEDEVVTQDFFLERYDNFYQPIYRFFNMRSGVHFYTADDAEFINTYKNLSSTFHYDGIAYLVPWGDGGESPWENPNTFPLYRLLNNKTGTHLYTMSEAEKTNILATRGDDYTLEGIAYYVSDHLMNNEVVRSDIGFPVYRFYVPRRDTHFFTADNSEMLAVQGKLSSWYHFEQIGFYVNDWENLD